MAKKVAFLFDPFKKTGIKIPRKSTAEARSLVADFVKDAVIDNNSLSKSSVSGGRWKTDLSKEYRKKVGKSRANLKNLGDLEAAIDVKEKKRSNTLSLEVSGAQAGKADGNNRGTYGKGQRSRLKNAREFIPRGKKTLSKEIWDGVRDILKLFKD